MPSGTVGWVVAHGTWIWEFGSSNPEGSLFFFSFSKFLSLVSLFRVRLSVTVSVSVSVGVSVRVRVSVILVLVLGQV